MKSIGSSSCSSLVSSPYSFRRSAGFETSRVRSSSESIRSFERPDQLNDVPGVVLKN